MLSEFVSQYYNDHVLNYYLAEYYKNKSEEKDHAYIDFSRPKHPVKEHIICSG